MVGPVDLLGRTGPAQFGERGRRRHTLEALKELVTALQLLRRAISVLDIGGDGCRWSGLVNRPHSDGGVHDERRGLGRVISRITVGEDVPAPLPGTV